MRDVIKSIIVIAILTVGILGLSIVANNRTQAQLGCSGTAPIGDAIHFQTATGRTPTLNQSIAVQTAKTNASFDVSGAQFTNAQFVLFSDDARGKANSIGDDSSIVIDYQDVPAWVVTFCGVSIPKIGSLQARNNGFVASANQEWNVVINAETGEVMEEYTFR